MMMPGINANKTNISDRYQNDFNLVTQHLRHLKQVIRPSKIEKMFYGFLRAQERQVSFGAHLIRGCNNP